MKAVRPWIALALSVAIFASGAFVLARDLLTHRSALPIKIVAHAWWWEFDYPTLGIKNTDALYLPSNRWIRLELRSADVVHSFWVEGMDTAIDLPPGKTEHLDLQVKSPGKLDGNCDAGCGCGTVCMRFKVMAKTPSEFNSWVAHERTHPESPGGTQHSAAPACALNKAIDRRGKRPTGGAAKPALRTSRFGRAVHVAGERKLGTFDG